MLNETLLASVNHNARLNALGTRMAPVSRRTVHNKMTLSGRSHQVQVRRCARYQHCTLTLFVGPAVRVSGWPPCTFRKKIGIDKYGFSTSDQKQSRHAKQVKSVVQHVTEHKPLVLRNGCDIRAASNGRPSHVQQICTNTPQNRGSRVTTNVCHIHNMVTAVTPLQRTFYISLRRFMGREPGASLSRTMSSCSDPPQMDKCLQEKVTDVEGA